MAFNFNWSPLTADEDFYKRARDLLTTALNKSPKPPIIVDDIIVTEFNLGSVPPDLEILEIGDLAEDRFRGIFKMRYSGDAFLTLRTRVQVRLAKQNYLSRSALCANKLWTGKPAQHISLGQAELHITKRISSRCEPHHPATDHLVRDQAVGFHHPRLLQAKGSD